MIPKIDKTMADTQIPPPFKFGQIYIPQLESTFTISEKEAFDYYSTNSGMYPKNPGGSGGGGGGDPSEEIQGLKNRMSAVENKQKDQGDAAKKSIQMLSDGYIEANDISEVDNLISNQDILRTSQENLLSSF